MSAHVRHRGPWTQRVLVWSFTVVLAVLLYWLIGFLLSDIGNQAGPDYQAIEQRLLDPQLTTAGTELAEQLAETARSIERETNRQQVLRDSTAEAQRTMAQLLDFQRLAMAKGVTPSAEEQQALAESQSLFLENQRQFQELNQQIGALEKKRDALQEQQRLHESRLEKARLPIEAEFARQWDRHRWRSALLKLGLMLPLMIVTGCIFLKWRTALYAPLVFALGAAVVLHTGQVMHEYFPTRWFKYLLIGTSLAVVLRALVYLVRSIAHPKQEWLLRQYREAYERFLCPICEYPIRRGPLKFLFWTRRTAKKLPLAIAGSEAEAETPYCCPLCGTQLFGKCPVCQGMRHCLLPACEHCGTRQVLAETTGSAAGPVEQ